MKKSLIILLSFFLLISVISGYLIKRNHRNSIKNQINQTEIKEQV